MYKNRMRYKSFKCEFILKVNGPNYLEVSRYIRLLNNFDQDSKSEKSISNKLSTMISILKGSCTQILKKM